MPSKILAEKKRAERWVAHFEENGITDTVWHETLERLEDEIKRLKKPKAIPQEVEHGA
jgi:hypothetical protein